MKREKNKKDRLARSSLPRNCKWIPGWPREHYTIDHKEKHQYKNEESAKRAASDRQRRYNELFEAYHCQYCGCWHIGHRKLLPIDRQAQHLKTIIEGEIAVINRYKADIDSIARSVLVLQDKLDKMEATVREHHRELFMLQWEAKNTNNNLKQNDNERITIEDYRSV